MNNSNKIDVKPLIMPGQRVVKVTDASGAVEFLTVGLSSKDNPRSITDITEAKAYDVAYYTGEGNKQLLDLSGESITETGTDSTSPFLFKTGVTEPQYPAVGGAMRFYMCDKVYVENGVKKWDGFLMQQDAATALWRKSDTLTTGLGVYGALTPEKEAIYDSTASVRIELSFSYSNPLPIDGLVFYAPLKCDSKELISGKYALQGRGGTFTDIDQHLCLYPKNSPLTWAGDGIQFPELTDGVTMGFCSKFSEYSIGEYQEGIFALDKYAYIRRYKSYIKFSYKSSDVSLPLSNTTQNYPTPWHTWIISRQANGASTLYYNGTAHSTGTAKTYNHIPSMYTVGFSPSSSYNNRNFTGYVQNAFMYKKAMSASEVLNLHNILMESSR